MLTQGLPLNQQQNGMFIELSLILNGSTKYTELAKVIYST